MDMATLYRQIQKRSITQPRSQVACGSSLAHARGSTPPFTPGQWQHPASRAPVRAGSPPCSTPPPVDMRQQCINSVFISSPRRESLTCLCKRELRRAMRQLACKEGGSSKQSEMLQVYRVRPRQAADSRLQPIRSSDRKASKVSRG